MRCRAAPTIPNPGRVRDALPHDGSRHRASRRRRTGSSGRSRGEGSALGDLRDGRPVRRQLQQLRLPRGQRRVPGRDGVGRQLRVDVAVSGVHGTDDLGELLRADRLRHEAPGARRQGPLEVARAAVPGHDHGAAAGQFRPQGCGDPHAVGAGHLEVQHRDIGPVRPRHGDRLGPGRRFGDDLDVVLQPQQRRQRPPDQVLVIRQQHADAHGVRGHRRSSSATGLPTRAPGPSARQPAAALRTPRPRRERGGGRAGASVPVRPRAAVSGVAPLLPGGAASCAAGLPGRRRCGGCGGSGRGRGRAPTAPWR